MRGRALGALSRATSSRARYLGADAMGCPVYSIRAQEPYLVATRPQANSTPSYQLILQRVPGQQESAVSQHPMTQAVHYVVNQCKHTHWEGRAAVPKCK